MQAFVVHPDFEMLFQEYALTSGETFFSLTPRSGLYVRVLRTLKMRANIYFELQGKEKKFGFYLKTHQPLSFWQSLGLRFGFKRYIPAGWGEWEQITQLKAYLPTMTAVSAGILPGTWGKYTGASFCITEALYGYIQLDHYLRTETLTRALIQQVANYAKQFHALHFSHKDFYLCHWFYHPQTQHLALIDLQRLTRPLFFYRWRIKDIAELDYSTYVLPLKRTDKLRFIRFYFGLGSGEKLTQQHKRFITVVLKKSLQIRQHNRGYK